MKKYFIGLLVVTMCFFITGCGKDIADLNNDVTDNAVEESSNSVEDEIELYSDSTKIVFANGNTKLVYYYSGEKITKYEAYIDYGNAATANIALAQLNDDDDDTIKNKYTKGRYLIIEYDDSVYENTTTSEIRTLYSYLKEVQKDK